MINSGRANLAGKRILVVEDEFYLAEDLANALADAGADVAGPASTVRKAHHLVEESPVNLAVLDINLKNELVFPLADELSRRNVPFVFTTGYDQVMIPVKYEAIERWEKPIAMDRLVTHLATL